MSHHLSSREYIQKAIDTILKKKRVGGIVTTGTVYDAVSARTRTITRKNVAIQMRERHDLKWIRSGEWEKVNAGTSEPGRVCGVRGQTVETPIGKPA